MDFNELLNLGDIDETQVFDVIPAGQYAAVVSKVEEGTGKTGNRYIRVEFAIDDPMFQNWKVSKFFSCWHTKLTVAQRAMVELKNVYKILNANIADSETLVGRECAVVVGINEYMGKQNNSVEQIQSRKEADNEPMPF